MSDDKTENKKTPAPEDKPETAKKESGAELPDYLKEDYEGMIDAPMAQARHAHFKKLRDAEAAKGKGKTEGK